VLLADYSGMRMRGTTFRGKAEAGATAILRVAVTSVKGFFHLNTKSIILRKFINIIVGAAGDCFNMKHAAYGKVAIS
jgi:hypothetical protein